MGVPVTPVTAPPPRKDAHMSDVGILINTAIAVAAVVLLIVRFKFNPVVSLVVGSAYLGLTTGLGTAETVKVISTGFGDIMAEVGLLIAFGVLMGAMLKEMGAIQRLVETLLRIFGPKRMPYALSLTIATASQSIFLDVLLVISAPLARCRFSHPGSTAWSLSWTYRDILICCPLIISHCRVQNQIATSHHHHPHRAGVAAVLHPTTILGHTQRQALKAEVDD